MYSNIKVSECREIYKYYIILHTNTYTNVTKNKYYTIIILYEMYISIILLV